MSNFLGCLRCPVLKLPSDNPAFMMEAFPNLTDLLLLTLSSSDFYSQSTQIAAAHSFVTARVTPPDECLPRWCSAKLQPTLVKQYFHSGRKKKKRTLSGFFVFFNDEMNHVISVMPLQPAR